MLATGWLMTSSFYGGIGKDSALPWPRLRADFAHFKQITVTASEGRRNAIVMGRRTWESKEIAGKPLPRRLNVVLSRSALVVPDGAIAASSFAAAIADRPDVEATFVIGGAEIYRLAFAHPALRYVYLTRIEGRFGCDAHFPDLGEVSSWIRCGLSRCTRRAACGSGSSAWFV